MSLHYAQITASTGRDSREKGRKYGDSIFIALLDMCSRKNARPLRDYLPRGEESGGLISSGNADDYGLFILRNDHRSFDISGRVAYRLDIGETYTASFNRE